VNTLRAIIGAIERASEWSGKGVSWLLLALVFSLTYDTFMRYLFRAPTFWAFDISYMLGGTIMLMGMAWVTCRRSQVRVDILYTRMSERAQKIVDSVLNIIIFLPLFAVLLYQGFNRAMYSYKIKEFSEVGFWRPIMWPYRWMIVVALALWLLATITWVVRDMHSLARGKEL
jgi:TRAP-type mannitol/chloroaromatic compound transport system permease small subunit